MKKLLKDRRGTNYSFYIDPDKMEKLEDLKWRERKSLSKLISEAIDEYLTNHVEGNKSFSLEKWQEDPEFQAIPTLLSPEDRWNRYIMECNDDELTKLAIATTAVRRFIDSRRTNEFNKKKIPMNSFRRVG